MFDCLMLLGVCLVDLADHNVLPEVDFVFVLCIMGVVVDHGL